jgi:hypothetical protein
MGRGRRRKGMKTVSGWATGTTAHLPLGRLALCLDCETCFEVGSDPCPACGSRMWASVARFLDRRHAR